MAYRASYGADTYGTAFYGITGAIDGSTDVTYRPAYGASTYGTAVYGNEGSETATLTATCSAEKLTNGSATASTAITNTASAKRVRQGSATATLQSATISIGEEYVATDGFRPGYGLGTYGTNIYGRNDSVELGSASTTASLSTSASFVRKVKSSAISAASLTTTSSAVYSISASASVSISLSISASFERVISASATVATSLSTSASAIEKWEPVVDTAETWTPVSDVTDTWTPVAATSETWTEITWSRAAQNFGFLAHLCDTAFNELRRLFPLHCQEKCAWQKRN